jgi:hypothetical protein
LYVATAAKLIFFSGSSAYYLGREKARRIAAAPAMPDPGVKQMRAAIRYCALCWMPGADDSFMVSPFMKSLLHLGRGVTVVLVCAMLIGCFSYTREVDTHPTPEVVQPTLSSGQTTTTTTTDETPVQKQKTTTWGNGGTVQSQTTTTTDGVQKQTTTNWDNDAVQKQTTTTYPSP